MSGDPANSNNWANADVYVAAIGSTIPATVGTAFNGSWTFVGLLDGDAGFQMERSVDTSDKFAWGGILVKTARRNFKQTVKFSVLEDNAATRGLIWPGSSAGTIIVPRPGFILVGFETRDDGGKVHRLISKYRAQVDVDGTYTYNETDLTKVPLMATIYPNSSGELFTEQAAPTITSIAILALTLAISTAKPIDKLVATATYSDATTADISAQALWTTSDATKATVSGGYVTKVAAGTANVSCSFGGVNATAPSVVTVS